MASGHFHAHAQRDTQKLLATLDAVVVPALLANKGFNDTVRIWLPDCGTGKVAYALSALLARHMEGHGNVPTIQIFATDSDAQAIAAARRGDDLEALTLPTLRLNGSAPWREDEPLAQHKVLRERLIFAQHFVLRDPPFMHLDLIVCQQILATLSEAEQEQISHEFHWCLRPGGHLLLGTQAYSMYLTQLFVRHVAAPQLLQRRDTPTAHPYLPQYAARTNWPIAELPQIEVSEHLNMVNQVLRQVEVNEHLQTMNQVLRQRVVDLTQANNDLTNLIAATDLAIIFLDQMLQITRFTPLAAALFNLIATDRGRPLAHIKHTLDYDTLLDDAAEVLESLQISEREVSSTDGRWYMVRLRPYRTTDERIVGVVVVCVDITARRIAEAELRRAHDELEMRVMERTEELRVANTQLQAEIAERVRLEQERTDLLRKIVMAQEDERRRIGRELHDQLGQSISALNVGVSLLATPALPDQQRQQMQTRLQQIVMQLDQDMDRLVLDLRPMALDTLGLTKTIRQHVEQWAEHSGILAEFEYVEQAPYRLQPAIEDAIFRVIQEALTNILKHAAAHHVSVILEQLPEQLRVIVEDDGRGFDLEALQATAHAGRLGLVGMRERVALVGGTLTFQTEPGAGTTVFVQIPR